MSATPSSDRALIGRIAAHESWARTPDRAARTAAARRAAHDRFENEVDPDRVLPAAERAQRAEHARKAYFTRLALRSAQSRRRAVESRAAAIVADQAADEAEAELQAAEVDESLAG